MYFAEFRPGFNCTPKKKVSKPLEDENEKRRPTLSQREDSKLKETNYLTGRAALYY